MCAALPAIAVLFRTVARAEMLPDKATLYAKVEDADTSKGTAVLKLTVMPEALRFHLQGDVSGMSAGDYLEFHLGENWIKWKGRLIPLSGIGITP